jgi:hypothetical protein
MQSAATELATNDAHISVAIIADGRRTRFGGSVFV